MRTLWVQGWKTCLATAIAAIASGQPARKARWAIASMKLLFGEAVVLGISEVKDQLVGAAVGEQAGNGDQHPVPRPSSPRCRLIL